MTGYEYKVAFYVLAIINVCVYSVVARSLNKVEMNLLKKNQRTIEKLFVNEEV